MGTVTVVREAPIPPVKSVDISMTLEEARALRHLFGRALSPGLRGSLLSPSGRRRLEIIGQLSHELSTALQETT